MLAVPLNRCCPVPQDCGGHTEYVLQRQTVLKQVSETIYESKPVTVEREIHETIYQPRTVTTVKTVSPSSTSATCPTRSSVPSTRR